MAAWFEFAEQYPVLLFFMIVIARVLDVSIGTVRTICVVKGKPYLAAVLGFIEVVIWVIAVSGVLTKVTVLRVIAYGIGFSLGNLIGIYIERRLALGRQMLMIMSARAQSVTSALRLQGYRAPELTGYGQEAPVTVCICVIRRRNTEKAVQIARAADPDCFININDVYENEPLTGGGELDLHASATASGWRAIFKKK